MSNRSEQRSAEEDWRAAAQEKDARASFLVRWGLLVALLAVVAVINVVAWLAMR
jgi:hypothetical protein